MDEPSFGTAIPMRESLTLCGSVSVLTQFSTIRSMHSFCRAAMIKVDDKRRQGRAAFGARLSSFLHPVIQITQAGDLGGVVRELGVHPGDEVNESVLRVWTVGILRTTHLVELFTFPQIP